MNFTLLDIEQVARASLVCPLFLLIPGYAIAWLCNSLGFRQRSLTGRAAIAVPFSIGIGPFANYALWRISDSGPAVFYSLCAALFCVSLISERGGLFSRLDLWTNRGYLALIALWIAAATLSLVDLQIGGRLYFPTVAYDYATRSAFTAAAVRTGLPPCNPYFFPGHCAALRYHYFWFGLCALVQRWSGDLFTPGPSSRQAMIACSVWCGIGLLAAIPLYLRFLGPSGAHSRRRTMIAAALLGVTGLDFVPAVFIELVSGRQLASVEWWNDPIMGWFHAVLWVPHHIAALIASLTAFIVLWSPSNSCSPKTRAVSLFLAAIMLSSSLGLSVYVTFVTGVFLAVWMLGLLFSGRRSQAVTVLLTGLTVISVSVPYLSEILAGQATGGASVSLQFFVRAFRIVDVLAGIGSAGWGAALAHMVLLPVNYGLELGFFLIVGIVQGVRLWRRKRISEPRAREAVLLLTAVFICSFIRSDVISTNDLGIRGFLPAQFVLLIWGAQLLDCGLLRLRTAWRPFAVAALILGIAGTAYEAFKIRFFTVLSDSASAEPPSWLSADRNLGERTYVLRAMYESLNALTGRNAVFEHNPAVELVDLQHGMYADRQLAAEGSNCETVFGGDPDECRLRIDSIARIFHIAGDPGNVCRAMKIDVLVIQRSDPVWKDPHSWVWREQPLVWNSFARAFECKALTAAYREDASPGTDVRHHPITVVAPLLAKR